MGGEPRMAGEPIASANQANGTARAQGATVEFRHVTKHYAAREAGAAAVEDLSLHVPPGEICVLVGPSGCGKTTSLRMVNRLVEPTSGQVLVDGEDVARIQATTLRRGIGYVIQQTGLFPHRTIAQNIGTVPDLLGWPRSRTRARVDELLELIGLDPALVRDRYPAQLSGGERQRVGVARAMASEPPVMLMDEPFGAVDPITRERLQTEFLRLHHQLRSTVIFVTHDIDEAIKMGDRVAVMRQGGHLEQYAPPADLLTKPVNDFVARFVGSDRGLKRLALIRLADLPLEQTSLARVGATIQPPRNATDRYTLLLDANERPVGWMNLAHMPPGSRAAREAADASSPFVRAETTLRDTLSMMLGCSVQTAVVVDDDGRYRGVITIESIAQELRGSVALLPGDATPELAIP